MRSGRFVKTALTLQQAGQAGIFILLALVSANAGAAPGFIAGSRVTKGNFMAEVTVEFVCGVQYLSHEPRSSGSQLRVRLESTGVCNGVAPSIADTREQYRPAHADDAQLVSIEYDGESPGSAILRFNFDDDVRYTVAPPNKPNAIVVRVFLSTPDLTTIAKAPPESGARRIDRPKPASPKYVINLESSVRPPAAADRPTIDPGPGRRFFFSQVDIDGTTWHRLRLGYFDTAEAAAQALSTLRASYPSAWIDRETAGTGQGAATDVVEAPVRTAAAANPAAAAATVPTTVAAAATAAPDAPASAVTASESPAGPSAAGESSKVETLMADARKAMIAGEISRAVQIYTKVLQLPPNPHQQQAQEYLGLARERNGQLAHAKAEYQRYLSLYPDTDGAARVQQRLSALLAQGGASKTAVAGSPRRSAAASSGPWTARTFFSQYYRRDVNQLNDNDEIVSQSSIYSDVNVDLRRRGERFDFSSRITAGYRYDMLDEQTGSGNDLRLSYAYADLADARTGLRGRIGRQSRSSGGVLGRFDGVNLGYQANEWLRFDAVAGKPVYSTADGVDDARTFYGLSGNVGPIVDNLDVGAFFLQQTIDGITDRQVVGGELRYFAENQTLWGLVDYDTSFQEIGSAFVQGSWRLPKLFTVTGLFDRRRSPFLSTGNAIMGQGGLSFAQLADTMTEEELRQLALDRAATTTTMTVGLSRPLSTKLQLSLNVSEAQVDATPESGGVGATPSTTYSYYSANLVASSLLKQGDVTIFGIRYADSDTTEVWSANLDTRFPIGRSFRINPRLRVDHRLIRSDMSEEWIYTPGLRMQYRWGRSLRLEFEAGKRFASREMTDLNLDRESYFVNFGYQFFY